MNVKLRKSEDSGHQDASIICPLSSILGFYGKTWESRTHPLLSSEKPSYRLFGLGKMSTPASGSQPSLRQTGAG